MINGNEGILVIKEDISILYWSNQGEVFYIQVNLDKITIIAIAESIEKKIYKILEKCKISLALMVIYIEGLKKHGERDEKRFNFGIISFFASRHSYNASKGTD